MAEDVRVVYWTPKRLTWALAGVLAVTLLITGLAFHPSSSTTTKVERPTIVVSASPSTTRHPHRTVPARTTPTGPAFVAPPAQQPRPSSAPHAPRPTATPRPKPSPSAHPTPSPTPKPRPSCIPALVVTVCH